MNHPLKKIALATFLVVSLSAKVYASSGAREVSHEERVKNAAHPQMTLNEGGELKPGEYIIIDLSGSVTRSLCPYTCKDRGLAKAHCHMWPSKINPNECYVQDTRVASGAFSEKRNGSHASREHSRRGS